ncbi:hypothetical protein BD560DRAFT_440228 [Blakeslea trispora]|nr:hypothetical protein BD560DRAFT_440228 [Blakeslea trispora]
MASVWLEKIHSGHAEQTVAAEGFLRTNCFLIPYILNSRDNLKRLPKLKPQQYEETRHLQTSILNLIKDIATGRAPLQINIDWPTGSNVPMTTVRSLSSAPSSVPSSTPSSVPSSDEQSHSIVLTSSTRSNVVFRMSNVQIISDLYREGTEGLGGNHSIV